MWAESLHRQGNAQNSADWQQLIGLLRSLASAELPIRNICSFVSEGLRQNKRNEDKLDAILSAYVAAYWWRFGVQRSTMIGDLSTGYIVTPHSQRTLEALTRVFRGRMNSHPEEPATKADPPTSLPRCDWVYFASSVGKWSAQDTWDFVTRHNVIVRNIHNAAHQRIAMVQYLKAGERILLVYGGEGQPYRALLSGTITDSADPVRTSQYCFDVFSCIDESLDGELLAGGYRRDPVVPRFTGISITSLQDLRSIRGTIPRRLGDRQTIWRWDEVF